MLPSDYSLITMLQIKKYFVSFVSFAKVRCFRLLLVALFAQSQLSLSISSIDCQRLLCHPLPWDAFPTSIMEHLSIFYASLHVILPQGSKSLLGKLKWIGASTPTGTFGVRQISHQSILLPSFFLFPVIPVQVVANRRCPMFLNKCGLLIMRCMIIFNCFKDRPYYQPTFTKFLLCVEHSAFISNSF